MHFRTQSQTNLFQHITNTTRTLYFVQIVVLLLGKQMRVSVLSGVDLSNKQRLEPAVFTETGEAPVMEQNTQGGYDQTLSATQ